MTSSKNSLGMVLKSSKKLQAAVGLADIVNTLKTTGPCTVFAPADAVFAAKQSDIEVLLKPVNKATIAKDRLTLY